MTELITSPMLELTAGLRRSKLVRFYEFAMEHFDGIHLKELAISAVGQHREMWVDERLVVNFGFDSFLGLDQDAARETGTGAEPSSGVRNSAHRGLLPVVKRSSSSKRKSPPGWELKRP